MILFLEDWQKYPNAIVHESTKNISFLRFAALLKKMGVKNHVFMLALHNPRLEYIDTFSPNLSVETMVEIAIECRDNPWYFLRECARAPAVGGIEDDPFRANRGNIALWWLYFNHITTMLIQIRQTGKTFAIAALVDYLLNIGSQNNQLVLLTKDDSLRSSTLDKIRDFEDSLPEYLVQRDKADISNTAELAVRKMNNKFTAILSSSSEKAANNVGRGFTSPTIIVDEGAFIKNIKIALAAMLPASGAARDIAKRNGTPYGTILATTVGKKNDKDGRYVYDMEQSSLVWTERLYDCLNLEDLEDTIRKNNSGIVRVNCTFNHRQLGYTDEWLKEKLMETNSSGEEADRDYFNKWTSGNDRSPLSVELLDKIKESEAEPIYVEFNAKGYILNWHIDENDIYYKLNNHPCILGVDTSNASGNDDIALVLIDVTDGSTIMTASINETNLITFSVWLLEFIVRYKAVTTIIENRSTGPAIIDYLLKMLPAYDEDPYKRLFNRIVNDRAAYPERFSSLVNYKGRRDESMLIRDKKYFGFSTSGSGLTSRSELYGMTLQNMAKKIGDKIKSTKLINQLMTLVYRNDRVDHDVGAHDDMVIALLLAFWLMSYGENLEVYGIKSNMVLSAISDSGHTRTKSEIYDDIQNKIVGQEIEELLTKLNETDDDNVAYMYEKRVRFLSSKLPSGTFLGSDSSLDEVLNRIKEKKRLARLKQKDGNEVYYHGAFTSQSRNQQPAYQVSSTLFGMRDRF